MVVAEFKYPLTRFCLRSGQMTLPYKMLELFPNEGTVKASDTLTNEEIELSFTAPRTVTGLMNFYKRHELNVNDKIEVKCEEGERYLLTPIKIGRRVDYSSPGALDKVLNKVLEKGVPLSESEIREIYPEIPKTIDLNLFLKQDKRFVRHEGRWCSYKQKEAKVSLTKPSDKTDNSEKIDSTVVANPFSARAFLTPLEQPKQSKKEKVAVETLNTSPDDTKLKEKVTTKESDASFSSTSKLAAQNVSQKKSANSNTIENSLPEAPSKRVKPEGFSSSSKTVEKTKEATQSLMSNSTPKKDVAKLTTNNLATSEASINTTGSSLELEAQGSTYLHKRVRGIFEKLGYSIEVLAKNQLCLCADLGRYNYNVLVYFSPMQHFDWANLLTRRRDTGIKYLAIFGDHYDLLKVTLPTDLARATLWSWQGIARLSSITGKTPVSPIDLEPYFSKEGLFAEGIKNFEEMIFTRIAEQGIFSTILATLANMKTPCVFLLDDVFIDIDFPREQLAKVLDTLSQAPFQLLSKVADGEYNIRSTVSEALLDFSEYAISVRDRLHKQPINRNKRLGNRNLNNRSLNNQSLNNQNYSNNEVVTERYSNNNVFSNSVIR